jgi:glycosyltransferase involved in cell wall biosynthesis
MPPGVADARCRLAVVASHPIQYQSPLWRGLAKNGLEVDVLYLAHHGTGATVDADFGRSVRWDSDLFSGFNSRFLPLQFPAPPGSFFTGASGTAASAILRGHYDAILVSGYSNVGYLVSWMAGRISRTPVYVRAETVSWSTKRAAGASPLRHRAVERVLRPLLRSYRGAFPIGEDSEAFYREMGVDPGRLTRVPYGVDNRWFARPAPDAIAEKRAELGCGPDDLVVMHAGKLIERKRPEQAIRVAAELRRRGARAKAVLVGSGPLETSVRTTMDPEDSLLGFANQSQMPLLYAAADVVLVPSTYETWGLVVNEALAAGTPVLSSAHVPAAVEMTRSTDVVQVFPSMDAASWADACLLLHQRDRESLAQEAMACVAPYDVEKAASTVAARIKQDLG